MKITFPLGAISTGPTTITLGEVAATNWSVSAEQLAAVWNRPVEEIRARLLRLHERPSDDELKRLDKWLTSNGLTPTAKLAINSNNT